VGGRSAADSGDREQTDREQSSLLHDETWIRAQDPQHFTIQVMALHSRDNVEDLMRKYSELAPFAVFTVQKGTKPLHVLLQGDYPDVESARAAKARFPREIQQQDALWIRRFDMVQRLLEQ
jgi:DamX protein